MPKRMPLIAPIADPLLLVDAGNTRTKIGLFNQRTLDHKPLPKCEFVLALPGDEPFPWETLRIRLGKSVSRMDACLTGSHPQRVAEIERHWPKEWPAPQPLIDRSKFPITIDVDFPARVGIDRLLNGIAANHMRPPGCAAIIIDSGTTTTLDYVDANARFCGGVILPGFDLSARALNAYTALLPLVDKGSLIQSPPPEIGRNTEAAIQAGLYWGHVGSVREILKRFMERSPSAIPESATGTQEHLVLITGGGGPLLLPHFDELAKFEPNLTLQGLALVAAKRSPAASFEA